MSEQGFEYQQYGFKIYAFSYHAKVKKCAGINYIVLSVNYYR